MRTATFSDPAVREWLSRRECYWENQVPGVYEARPPGESYPREMTESCLEGAGGNNLRHFLCDSDGLVRQYFTGYWKPERFLRELAEHDPSHAEDDASTPLARAQRNLLRRNHEEERAYIGRPIADVLRQVRDEVYTKGKAG